MQSANLRVSLLSHTANPEELILVAFKQCYQNGFAGDMFDKILTSSNPEDVVQRKIFIKDIMSSGHESPIEHVSFTFAVEGISRSLTHQLVRHRIASYSQASQRYINGENFNYICPPHIERIPEAKAKFLECLETIGTTYKDLRKILTDSGYEKIANEEARSVLPQATETKIVVTMNCRSLWHFFNERCCNRAQYEIRQMANQMLKECRDVLPVIFDDAGAKCERTGCCPEIERFTCGKYPRLVK